MLVVVGAAVVVVLVVEVVDALARLVVVTMLVAGIAISVVISVTFKVGPAHTPHEIMQLFIM